LEDRIVQRATVAVLGTIYEEDFVGFSYGCRPKRSQQDALGVGLGVAATLQRPELAIHRCTNRKVWNLLAKAPAHLREELAEDYRRISYAASREAGEHAWVVLSLACRPMRAAGLLVPGAPLCIRPTQICIGSFGVSALRACCMRDNINARALSLNLCLLTSRKRCI